MKGELTARRCRFAWNIAWSTGCRQRSQTATAASAGSAKASAAAAGQLDAAAPAAVATGPLLFEPFAWLCSSSPSAVYSSRRCCAACKQQGEAIRSIRPV